MYDPKASQGRLKFWIVILVSQIAYEVVQSITMVLKVFWLFFLMFESASITLLPS